MIKQKKYVNSYYFVKTLSKVSGLNDTIVTDMGFSFTSTHQAIEIKKIKNFIQTLGMPNGMGFASSNWSVFFQEQ